MNFRPTAPSQAQALNTLVNPPSTSSSLFADEQYLTPDGKKLYFTVRNGNYGSTSPSVEERWVTDGTAVGTSKVGNALYSGKNYLYLRNARNFTSIGGDRFIYQAGEGIWVSDINGNNPIQLKAFDGVPVYKQPSRPSGLIVNQTQNGTVFFTGDELGPNGFSLWRSDGTAAGTVKVKEFQPRVYDSYGSYSPDTTTAVSLGNTLYFTALNGTVQSTGLWQTNALTNETRLVDFFQGKIDSLSSRNQKLFFSGKANDGRQGWWLSDGTAAGTKFLGDFVLWSPHDARELTQSDKFYFAAEAKDGRKGLWITDTNTAATKFLGGVPTIPLDSQGYYLYRRLNIATLANRTYVWFDAAAWSNGKVTATEKFWETDGTTIGTKEIIFNDADGQNVQNFKKLFIPSKNTEAIPELFKTAVNNTISLIDSRQLIPEVPATTTLILGQNLNILSNDWAIKGTLKSNTLAHNQTTGEVAVFNPAGQKTAIYTVSDTNWQIKGIADLNGDGEQDLFWQHKISGQTAIWNLKNQAIASGVFLISVTDPNWKVEGFADMDKDGKIDVLWQHKTQGTFAYWKMDDNNIKSGVYLPSAPDLNWSVKGLADFDKDGDMDILWQNDSTGEIKLWRLENNKVAYTVNLGTVADRNWQIRGVADMDRDGQYDLLWTNTATREVAFWSWAGDDAWKTDYQAYVSPESLATGDPSKWTYNFYKSVTPRGTYLNRLKASEIDAIGIV
jgi:ELWxxDGT repeat protein